MSPLIITIPEANLKQIPYNRRVFMKLATVIRVLLFVNLNSRSRQIKAEFFFQDTVVAQVVPEP